MSNQKCGFLVDNGTRIDSVSMFPQWKILHQLLWINDTDPPEPAIDPETGEQAFIPYPSDSELADGWIWLGEDDWADMVLQSDGTWAYPPPPPPPPPTPEQFYFPIREFLNSYAKAREYDDATTLCTYTHSSNVDWKAEADAFIAWRDAIIDRRNTLLNQMKDGTIEIGPQPSDFLVTLTTEVPPPWNLDGE